MIRSIKRTIARNRLKDMAVGNVNQKMGMRYGDKETMPGREAINKLQKTKQGRERLTRSLKEHPALWMEVLNGRKKKEADSAATNAATIRKMIRHADNPDWPKKKESRHTGRSKPVPGPDCTGVALSAHV